MSRNRGWEDRTWVEAQGLLPKELRKNLHGGDVGQTPGPAWRAAEGSCWSVAGSDQCFQSITRVGGWEIAHPDGRVGPGAGQLCTCVPGALLIEPPPSLGIFGLENSMTVSAEVERCREVLSRGTRISGWSSLGFGEVGLVSDLHNWVYIQLCHLLSCRSGACGQASQEDPKVHKSLM